MGLKVFEKSSMIIDDLRSSMIIDEFSKILKPIYRSVKVSLTLCNTD